MCETATADGQTATAIPTDAILGFLEASRELGQSGYVDTEATRFSPDGSARIVLTHTHQGAFRTVSKLARRFGFITSGNRDAGGQRFRHIAGTTPTLRAEYDPNAYNVVMLNAPNYTGDSVAFAPTVAIGVSRTEAVEKLRTHRDGDEYRDDVDYKLQHAGTQTFEEIDGSDDSDDSDDDRTLMTDGGCHVVEWDERSVTIDSPAKLVTAISFAVDDDREADLVTADGTHRITDRDGVEWPDPDGSTFVLGDGTEVEFESVDALRPAPGSEKNADVPDYVPDALVEKVGAAVRMAVGENDMTPDVTLVEAAAMAGLDYDKLTEIADDMGYDVDELNESGMGFADSPDDVERPDPDAESYEYCSECGEVTAMDMWRQKRGSARYATFRCQTCGGEGTEFYFIDGNQKTGVLADD